MSVNVEELVASWESTQEDKKKEVQLHCQLPMGLVAKIAALVDLYPDKSQDDIIRELLSIAVAQVESAFPYVPGPKVVAEDDQCDPVYEDLGPSPKFHQFMRKHLKALQHQ